MFVDHAPAVPRFRPGHAACTATSAGRRLRRLLPLQERALDELVRQDGERQGDGEEKAQTGEDGHRGRARPGEPEEPQAVAEDGEVPQVEAVADDPGAGEERGAEPGLALGAGRDGPHQQGGDEQAGEGVHEGRSGLGPGQRVAGSVVQPHPGEEHPEDGAHPPVGHRPHDPARLSGVGGGDQPGRRHPGHELVEAAEDPALGEVAGRPQPPGHGEYQAGREQDPAPDAQEDRGQERQEQVEVHLGGEAPVDEVDLTRQVLVDVLLQRREEREAPGPVLGREQRRRGQRDEHQQGGPVGGHDAEQAAAPVVGDGASVARSVPPAARPPAAHEEEAGEDEEEVHAEAAGSEGGPPHTDAAVGTGLDHRQGEAVVGDGRDDGQASGGVEHPGPRGERGARGRRRHRPTPYPASDFRIPPHSPRERRVPDPQASNGGKLGIVSRPTSCRRRFRAPVQGMWLRRERACSGSRTTGSAPAATYVSSCRRHRSTSASSA